MLRLVPALVGAGISPRDLLAVFAGDTGRSADLWPLVVALEEHAGNQIRAPRQVKEVAADIRDRFIEAAERMKAKRLGSVSEVQRCQAFWTHGGFCRYLGAARTGRLNWMSSVLGCCACKRNGE